MIYCLDYMICQLSAKSGHPSVYTLSTTTKIQLFSDLSKGSNWNVDNCLTSSDQNSLSCATLCQFFPGSRRRRGGYRRSPKQLIKEPVAFGHPLEWDLISWIGSEGNILEQAKKPWTQKRRWKFCLVFQSLYLGSWL